MTKTIDEQLERLATAQEEQVDSLNKIGASLEILVRALIEGKFASPTVADVNIEEAPNAGADDEAATEETAPEEVHGTQSRKEAVEEEAAEPEPEPEEAGAEEGAAEDEAAGEDGDEGDPLGDGEADDPYQLPEKLTNDTLRGFARDLVEKDGKAAVFEVLADVGKGYKAVGEVSKADLQEAHEKMIARLRG